MHELISHLLFSVYLVSVGDLFDTRYLKSDVIIIIWCQIVRKVVRITSSERGLVTVWTLGHPDTRALGQSDAMDAVRRTFAFCSTL